MQFKFDVGITRIGQHNNGLEQRKPHEDQRNEDEGNGDLLLQDPGHTDSIPRILIDGVGIERINQAKVLGVTLRSS